jgi:nicotinamide riboside kinase
MKIGLCGTMSVGKTTLVNALKDLPEFKDYKFRTERSKYLRDMGIPLNMDSTLKGQIVFAAERAEELMQKNIITDRTIIDVMAFCNLSTSMEEYEKFQINNLLWLLIKDYDIIFYVSPEGVEMEDNGIRETNLEYRDDIDKEIKTILKMYQNNCLKIIKIKGSTQERIDKIKETVFHL